MLFWSLLKSYICCFYLQSVAASAQYGKITYKSTINFRKDGTLYNRGPIKYIFPLLHPPSILHPPSSILSPSSLHPLSVLCPQLCIFYASASATQVFRLISLRRCAHLAQSAPFPFATQVFWTIPLRRCIPFAQSASFLLSTQAFQLKTLRRCIFERFV